MLTLLTVNCICLKHEQKQNRKSFSLPRPHSSRERQKSSRQRWFRPLLFELAGADHQTGVRQRGQESRVMPTPEALLKSAKAAMAHGIKMHSVGDTTTCRQCNEPMVVTVRMVNHGNYRCRHCQSANAGRWARNNPARKRAHNRAYWSRNSDKLAAKLVGKTARYRARYPLKRAAHHAVQTAIRNGTLTRQPCTECKAPNSHAHHEDYGKPLDVLWLCPVHHAQRHPMIAERRKRKNEEAK